MKCPITGKTCTKHKAYTVEEKHGENSYTCLVCEDCMHMNPQPDKSDELGPCPRCGTTIDQVVGKSRLGCALCYEHFGEPLSYIIAAVQIGGEDRHVGRTPESFKRHNAESVDAIKFATELAQGVKIATREERYEDASRLMETLSSVKKVISSMNEEGELDPTKKAELAEIAYRHLYPESV